MTTMTSLQRALMDVEMNSLCNSFASLRISSSSSSSFAATAPAPAPVVLVGPVETILEEVALKRDGYEFSSESDSTTRMSDVDEYIQRRKDSDRMMKMEAKKFRDDMIQAGTPFCICVPLMDDFVSLNNNNDTNVSSAAAEDDEDKEVPHVEEETTTATSTTHFEDDYNNNNNVVDDNNTITDKAVRDGEDDESTVTTETTTTVTTEEEVDETATEDDETAIVIEEEQEEIPDMSSSSSTTTTTATSAVVVDDDDDDDNVIPPTVILQLLLAIVQYWVGSTVKFVLKLATLPLAVAAYIIYKTMKSLARRIESLLTTAEDECDGFEFEYDDQSVCCGGSDDDSDDETLLLDEDEVLELLYSRQYATEEEFQKAWEFEFGSETNRYVDYKFNLQRQHEAAMEAEWEAEEYAATTTTAPWWKFW